MTAPTGLVHFPGGSQGLTVLSAWASESREGPAWRAAALRCSAPVCARPAAGTALFAPPRPSRFWGDFLATLRPGSPEGEARRWPALSGAFPLPKRCHVGKSGMMAQLGEPSLHPSQDSAERRAEEEEFQDGMVGHREPCGGINMSLTPSQPAE